MNDSTLTEVSTAAPHSSSVPRRALGSSGLQVSPLAFGGNVFGWTVDEATSFSLLDAWLDAGCNFIDTADVYSIWAPGHVGGESETIIGKWLKRSGKRDQVVIATKLGKPMGEGRKGLSPAYMRKAVEASLRRLQTDHIDLYQSHDDDADTQLADTLAAFGELIAAGKVRAIGASNYSAARLEEALQLSEAQPDRPGRVRRRSAGCLPTPWRGCHQFLCAGRRFADWQVPACRRRIEKRPRPHGGVALPERARPAHPGRAGPGGGRACR
jgi:hypothetical protein